MTSHATLIGTAHPLGAKVDDDGTNFSLFAPFASKVELLLFEHEQDQNPDVIELYHNENKSFYYWHVFVRQVGKNQLYAYRVYGNNNHGCCFDSSKVLLDPYAKAIVGSNCREDAKKIGQCNLHNCLKSVVIDDDDFDWGGDIKPKHNKNKTVIYELHVGGFTKHPSLQLKNSETGTYAALTETIPYLKKLGITTIELLPVFAFDAADAPTNKTNYWGYSPINFFAVHGGYGTSNQSPQQLVNEFKQMIKEFHRHGFEVILDVVYNHTTENDKDGPNYCFRGISNPTYYLLDKDHAYLNYSGTGNTVNANHSVVRRMIIDSLQYWVQQMHVDGFRFDLASILSRDESGNPIANPPILWSIESDPVLANTKLIAEPWDASGLYQVYNFVGDKWAIWNDDYRDSIRSFLKSDAGMVQKVAYHLIGKQKINGNRYLEFTPDRNIHFVTSHDGFTLMDLVSYNQKHNWDNGEENRDGHNHNLSWNCGVEGQTNNAQINQLRLRQIKNAFALLILSHGTPMILMGDEVGRTQHGNNNAYCQDNPTAWMDWNLVTQHASIFDFVCKLIQIKKKYSFFSNLNYFDTHVSLDKPYVQFHGTNFNEADFSHESRVLAIEYINPINNQQLIWILNFYWEDLTFNLPENNAYKVLFNTFSDHDSTPISTKIMVNLRSSVLLEKQ